MHTRFIELAGEINESMPYYVIGKIQKILNAEKKCLNGANILVLGVTYKANIEDHRESPATKVMELLQNEGATLSYSDPYRPALVINGTQYKSIEVTPERLKNSDCALILTAHSDFDYENIVEYSPVVFDTRNGTRAVKKGKEKVFLL